MADAERKLTDGRTRIDFQTDPSRYRHWKLTVDGDVATLMMDVDEKGGAVRGLSSSSSTPTTSASTSSWPTRSSGCASSIRRCRWCCCAPASRGCSAPAPTSACWPAPRTPTRSTSASSPTRRATASRTRARPPACKTICVINGTAAGGGYELALATDHIMLVDDGSSTVSLPELPLLAVLPGTGGLTRVTDKRKVRRDLADVFCTTEEGVKGKRAVEWRLVDEVVPNSKFDDDGAPSGPRNSPPSRDRPAGAKGIALTPLKRERTANGADYSAVSVEFDARRAARHHHAARARCAAAGVGRRDGRAGRRVLAAAAGARARRRHPRPAPQRVRHRGASSSSRRAIPQQVLAYDRFLDANKEHWLAREIRHYGSACSSASTSPRARWWR